MWSQRDQLQSKSSCSIFIKNLDNSIDNPALYETFSVFGNIISSEVAVDEEGCSKGFGYVEFDSQQSADLAIDKVNGMLLNDKQVAVDHYCTKDKPSGIGSIFIKYLDKSIDNKALYETFSPFGNILSCMVAVDEKNISKGFGFVHYDTQEAADLAIMKANGMKMSNRRVAVSKWKSKEERGDKGGAFEGVNLYVKYLDDEIDTAKLCEIFSEFGQITSAKVMEDEKGNSRGFGFVCFMTAEEATKAVTEMNGRIVISKPLYVALAQRKDERRAFLETQYKQRAPAPQSQPTAVTPPPQIQQVYRQPAPQLYVQQTPQPQRAIFTPQTIQHVSPPWPQPVSQQIPIGAYYPPSFQPVQRVISPQMAPRGIPHIVTQDVTVPPQVLNGSVYWWNPGPLNGQQPPL